MVYKLITYVLIALGGTISGGLIGMVTGPIHLNLSIDNTSMLGASAGALLAVIGCRFAIEHHEAVERNRELLRAVEDRLTRALHSAKLNLKEE